MSKVNIIEIKAKSNNHNNIREILETLNAEFLSKDHQVDTYFNINKGKLKLRETTTKNYLIHYIREVIKGPKQSQVVFYESEPNSSLKKTLIESCGILVIVEKIREIYTLENITFHIDQVQNLGTFIEIEAIDNDGKSNNNELLNQCNKYMKLMNIDQKDLISDSYSDLLLNKKNINKNKENQIIAISNIIAIFILGAVSSKASIHMLLSFIILSLISLIIIKFFLKKEIKSRYIILLLALVIISLFIGEFVYSLI